MLSSGEVAGIVFAASTTERQSAYALTADQVRRTSQGVGRTAPGRTQGGTE